MIPVDGTHRADTTDDALNGRPADPSHLPLRWRGRVCFDENGLVPVIAQEAHTHRVLMLAWADAAALAHTLETGRGTYWSRSRQRQWVKGETSGHTQRVRQVVVDCDGDAVLYLVEQTGVACHTGAPSCFDTPGSSLARLTGVAGRLDDVEWYEPDAAPHAHTTTGGNR
jgi:phosphoribosyl-AMP cyclohydrolase